MHALASSLVGGVGRDAEHIAAHIASSRRNGRPTGRPERDALMFGPTWTDGAY